MLKPTILLTLLVVAAHGLLNTFPIQPEKILRDGDYYAATKLTSLSDAIHAVEEYIIQTKAARGMPSVVFSISVKGKKVMEKAWGLADIENAIPAQTNTHYRIASISKTFTSALIGTLVDQGLVKYDDPLSKYLSASEYPHKSWANTSVDITIAQLLDHTAGTHVTTVTDLNNHIMDVASVHQMIPKFKDQPLLYKPGDAFEYSNYGYQLLGAVIEVVTKKTFPQAMSELLQKFGLNSSHVETSQLVLENIARYYRFPNQTVLQKNIPTAMFDQMFPEEGWWPSGSLISTVGDLVHYGQAILDIHKGRSSSVGLSKKTLQEMWTPRTKSFAKFPFRPSAEYCYGWMIGHVTPTVNPNLKHRDFMWHSGGLVGVSSFLVIYPEEEIVAAVFTNKGYVGGLDAMALTAAEILYDFV